MRGRFFIRIACRMPDYDALVAMGKILPDWLVSKQKMFFVAQNNSGLKLSHLQQENLHELGFKNFGSVTFGNSVLMRFVR